VSDPIATAERKNTRQSMRRKNILVKSILVNWQLYLFVLPAVAYLLIFKYAPMYGIQIGFKNYKISLGFWGSQWVGLKHFIRFFNSYYFWTVIRNTLTITGLSLVLSFPLPVILALLLNEINHRRYKKFVQTISIGPHFISTVVLCGMLLLFLNPSSGILNHLRELIGFERLNFLQTPHMFKWIYILSGIWQGTGWASVIYFAALSGVNPNLVEAAHIDGANKLQRIIHIKFPVLIPTMVILLILRCGSLLSVGYEKVYLLQNGVNLRASEVISTYVYKAGLINADYSFSTAVGLFDSVVNCTILILVNYLAKKYSESSLW
jgi:putative aldouronate transport system permease protein